MNTRHAFFRFPALLAAACIGQLALAETTFSAGVSGENSSCGSLLPAAFGNYDRDSDDVAAHAYLRVSPGGGCSGSISVDTEVSKRSAFGEATDDGQAFVSAIIGFDQHTQTYEVEPNRAGTKAFHAQTEQAVTAAFGLGWDFGDVRAEIGFNAFAEYDDRLEPLFIHSASTFGERDEWELDFTLALPSSSAVLSWRDSTTLRLSYNANELGNYDGTAGDLVEGPPTLEIAIDVKVF